MSESIANNDYQVLARKWRPRNFQQMVGQQHVLKALINALDQNRLHHAYLFSGTRGVGKTTLGRILAKCLNCDQGVSSTPCGTCPTCNAIDAGRFVDLFEIDAASRTKVEDTRELLDNVLYAPVQGRYKIYLIDEVHMLSGHSFNALLKTLEEPPSHVKFILATTDPQRLPVTVLSRCLQFHLKNLPATQIQAHLQTVLEKEKIPFEVNALIPLAHAANGSMRDALSLLDQAIAYGGQAVKFADVNSMLGTVPQSFVFIIIKALAQRDIQVLFQQVDYLVEQGIDFFATLEELITQLHKIALTQVLPKSVASDLNATELQELAGLLSPEDVQLYYQIALIGRRDLPLAPNPRLGFEMVLLRLCTFQPDHNEVATTQAITKKITVPVTPAKASAKTTNNPTITKISPPLATTNVTNDWGVLLKQLNLSGLTAELAKHCALKEITENQIHLSLEPTHAALLNKNQQERLANALTQHFGKPIQLTISAKPEVVNSPAAIERQNQQLQQEKAIQSLQNDVNVQNILNTFGAELQVESIKSQESTSE